MSQDTVSKNNISMDTPTNICNALRCCDMLRQKHVLRQFSKKGKYMKINNFERGSNRFSMFKNIDFQNSYGTLYRHFLYDKSMFLSYNGTAS